MGRVTLSMEKQKTREGNTRLVGVILMCVTTILIILVTLQIIFHLAVLLYPAYMSIKAVQSKVKEKERRWLTYWLVYSFIHLLEPFIFVLLWVLPLYNLVKYLFLGWCLVPSKQNGATVTFNMIIRPVARHL